MAHKKKMARLDLCRKLHELALKIAADKPVRVGNRSVRIPDHVEFEIEFDQEDGKSELEIEVKW